MRSDQRMSQHPRGTWDKRKDLAAMFRKRRVADMSFTKNCFDNEETHIHFSIFLFLKFFRYGKTCHGPNVETKSS